MSASSSSAAASLDLSSLASLKAKDAVDFARHYGRCYWELSKARLRLDFLWQPLSFSYFELLFFLSFGTPSTLYDVCFECVLIIELVMEEVVKCSYCHHLSGNSPKEQAAESFLLSSYS